MAVNKNSKDQTDAEQIAEAARAQLREMRSRDEDVEMETPNGGMLAPPAPGDEVFEGQAKSLKVIKDVNVGQLMDEIDERLGDPEKYHVVGHWENDNIPVSADNPLTLFVAGGADMRTVRGAVESHVKDDHYGLSEEEREINDLKAKLKSGKDLPTADLNKLLRSIL